MKYEGTRKSGASNEHSVYMFSIGKEELAILTGLLNSAYESFPRGVVELEIYGNRLRNLHKVFGRVYIEQIKGQRLPTKHTNNFHKIITRKTRPKI